MAASTYETVRLDTVLTGQLPTSTWKVSFAGRRDINFALMTSETSLSGDVMVHRVVDGGGAVFQFIDRSYKLLLTQAEYLAFTQLIGKVCYFMPHIRDEAAPLGYRETVLVERLSEELPLNPPMEYFTTVVYLRNAGNSEVDS